MDSPGLLKDLGDSRSLRRRIVPAVITDRRDTDRNWCFPAMIFSRVIWIQPVFRVDSSIHMRPPDDGASLVDDSARLVIGYWLGGDTVDKRTVPVTVSAGSLRLDALDEGHQYPLIINGT
jgi:hypothetical protein